jgi:hypothetical protein
MERAKKQAPTPADEWFSRDMRAKPNRFYLLRKIMATTFILALSVVVGCFRAQDAGGFLSSASASDGLPPVESRKLILAVFGAGVRSSETIDDPQRRFIPRLWRELVPRGTLFTNARVGGKIVHPNNTAALLTGRIEWEDLDWSRPLENATIFEIFRKTRNAPDTDAWAFFYASILAKAGESRAIGFGADYAANVVLPPTIPRFTAEEMERKLREAAAAGAPEAEVAAALESAVLARKHARFDGSGLRSAAARAVWERGCAAWRAADGSTSHDAFLAEQAVAVMKEFAPTVLVVAFGETDCAHYGSWSRYTEAIRRTDELTWQLWRAAETLPAYRGRTLLLVIPDHGRELDRPGGGGFIHHSDFYTGQDEDEGCRRVWLLALGPGVAAGKKVSAAVPTTAVAPTALRFLGLTPSPNSAQPLPIRW